MNINLSDKALLKPSTLSCQKNKFKHSNFLFYPFSEFVLSAYVILQWGDVCERENCKGGFSILYLLDWALDNVYKWAMNPNI